jgi:WD repeat-containing protein 19
VIGTAKGTFFIYNKRTQRKMPITGKHSKKISSGAWNSKNWIALGSEDKMVIPKVYILKSSLVRSV